MVSSKMLRRLTGILSFICLMLAAAFLFPRPVLADDPGQATEEYCLSCHSNPDLRVTLPSGEVLSLFISPDMLAESGPEVSHHVRRGNLYKLGHWHSPIMRPGCECCPGFSRSWRSGIFGTPDNSCEIDPVWIGN